MLCKMKTIPGIKAIRDGKKALDKKQRGVMGLMKGLEKWVHQISRKYGSFHRSELFIW